MRPSKKQWTVITHPRMPYKAVAAVPVEEGSPVCIIELTGGFFRVIHMNSGWTLTDTEFLYAAERFVTATLSKYRSDSRFATLLDTVSWARFFQRAGGGPRDDDCDRLVDIINALITTTLPGHVRATVTRNEKYLYPPEFII